MSAAMSNQDLVVVGASAGGIEALSRLVATLPPDFPAPIVIAQHLEPSRVSHLGEILGRRSTIPVRSVNEHEALAASVVYVVPANRDVQITDHAISLSSDQPGRPKPSIDLLLASAAQVFGERLIAIILTGTGSDGVEGARRVKEAGGTVVVQNPETAQFPQLPQSLAPTTVDIVVDLEAIGPLLRDLLTGVYTPPSPTEDRQVQALLEQVRIRSGIDFSRYRQPTIRRRLQRRMADTNQDSIEEYTSYLRRHPEEYERLVGSFLIKVTDFFRDSELFDHLRTEVLPDVIAEARARGSELRLWSAGCATGEEAYSLAIMVADILGTELEESSVRIFATDIDPQAVSYARRGLYATAALDVIPADLRARYFTPVDGGYEVKKAIRRMIVFAPHDLGQRAPFPRIDLALCRNVLIYFTPELQRRALQLFAFALQPGGRLILGKSETTSPLPEHFVIDNPRLKVYRRRGDRVLIPTADIRGSILWSDMASSARADLARLEHRLPRIDGSGRSGTTRRDNSEQLLLDLPIGVVVDRQYDIQAINAAARRLLSVHSTAIGEDLIHLARRVPADRVRGLIDRALEGGSASERIEVRPVELPPGTVVILEITCFPRRVDIPDQSIENVVLLVSDVTSAAQPQPTEPPRPPEREAVSQALEQLQAAQQQPDDPAVVDAALRTARAALELILPSFDRLASELREEADAKRDLLIANQELTSNNTELRAQNEELLLTTEEAQAAMEEVETLSEEQQASNEELETLNEELQATIEELNTTNDDLEARGAEIEQASISLEAERSRLAAILASIGDGVLVVERSGRSILTNAAFDQMFGEDGVDFVPEDDQGRPLPREQWPQRRAASGETFRSEFTVTVSDGSRRWFEATSRPIDHDGHASGVIVFRDITDRGLLRLQDEFLAMASHELRTPLTALFGYLQLHRRHIESGQSGESVHRSITRAISQVEHLRVLVDDLLDAERLHTGKLSLRREPIDLTALVGRVVAFSETLGQGKALRLTLPSEPPIVNGDPVRLEQVLFNLITNAVEHAPETDAIDLTLRTVDGQAEIAVQDYGPGIPADEVGQIFSRFRQVSHGRPVGSRGLGLGLYIAHEIVTEHGGTIGVDSAEGQGARFYVRLPLLPDPPHA
jgi:two-component system, chemotaxis family, CheB/CheR fusion protein